MAKLTKWALCFLLSAELVKFSVSNLVPVGRFKKIFIIHRCPVGLAKSQPKTFNHCLTWPILSGDPAFIIAALTRSISGLCLSNSAMMPCWASGGSPALIDLTRILVKTFSCFVGIVFAPYIIIVIAEILGEAWRVVNFYDKN